MRLYIIGNGFDLAHGIKCSYQNFYKYVCENKSELAMYINEYYSNVDFWNEFETALGEIDAKYIYETEADACMLKDDFDERDLRNLSDNLNYKCQYIREHLHDVFDCWIKQIDLSKATKSVFFYKRKSVYLSFNYTETLEKTYHIPNSQILYIHGTRDNPIFGHNANECACFGPSEESWVATDDADDAVKKIFQCTIKPVDDIIKKHTSFFGNLSSVCEIVILGHSLNEIDRPYFEKIISIVPSNAQWQVSFHRNEDKIIFLKKMKEWGIDEKNIKLTKW